jgi:hypothetical protein
MSDTLSFGYIKPTTGDRGQALFDLLEQNIQRLNDHNHNGSNSSAINTASIGKVTQSISASGWNTPIDGVYSQVVAMTGGLQYDTTTITLRNSANGKPLFLSVERVDSSTFRMFCNDPSINILVIYA